MINDLSEIASDIVNPEDKINAEVAKFKEANKEILGKDEASVKKEDKAAAENALKAYEGLSNGAKAKLKEEKAKLDLINDLSEIASDIVNPEDKVNAEVAKFKEANKEILGKDEASVKKEDKAAAENALKAYEGLSNGAKAKLKEEKAKLDLINDLSEIVSDIVNPEDKVNAEVAKFKEANKEILGKDEASVKKEDKAAAENALKAYEGLSNGAKAKLKEEKAKLDLINDLSEIASDIVNPEDKVNAEVAEFKEDHKGILGKDEASVKKEDKAAAENALKAYEGLSNGAKAKLKEEKAKLDLINDLSEIASDIVNPEDKINAEVAKFKEDNKAILVKEEFKVTEKDTPAIEKALKDFGLLNDSAKEKLKIEKEKLDLMHDFTVVAEDIVNEKPNSSGHSTSSGSSSGGSSSGGSSSVSSSSSEIKETKKLENQNRISGKNRYETAVNVSKMLYKNGADVVIIANSEKYSDVLSAVPYANMMKAPVLYADFSRMPSETLNEIKRLKAKKVIFIGGEGTLNREIFNSLKKDGYTVDRIGGKDRYETSKLIADRMKALGAKGGNDVIMVNGENYPDALSASQLASKNQTPILLTKSDRLSKHTLEKIESNKNGKIYIIGGQNSVSASIENSLKAYKNNSVERFAGKDRYETSVKISKSLNSNPKAAVFASGETFQDALIAGEVSGHEDIPLVLVGKNKISDSVNDYLINNKFDKAYLIGGESMVKDIEVTTSKTK